jgi:hypothetical protein
MLVKLFDQKKKELIRIDESPIRRWFGVWEIDYFLEFKIYRSVKLALVFKTNYEDRIIDSSIEFGRKYINVFWKAAFKNVSGCLEISLITLYELYTEIEYY